MIAPELVKIQKSRISFAVARYFDYIGQYEKSLEAVEEFLECKPQHKRALKLKCSVTKILDRLPESIQACKQLLSLCKPVRDFWERTSLLNSIGSAYWRLKEPKLAIRYLESVVRLYEMYYRWGKEAFDEPILWTLWTLAEYQTKSGRLSDAIATYEKSLKFLSKTGPLSCFADPLHELGLLHYRRQELDKALFRLVSAAKIHESFERLLYSGYDHYFIAWILLEKKKFAQSLTHVRKSIAFLRKAYSSTCIVDSDDDPYYQRAYRLRNALQTHESEALIYKAQIAANRNDKKSTLKALKEAIRVKVTFNYSQNFDFSCVFNLHVEDMKKKVNNCPEFKKYRDTEEFKSMFLLNYKDFRYENK